MSISVWQSIKKRLRVRVNPILIRVWIDPLEATYADGVVRIVAPNEFVEEWVRKNLLVRIREAAGEVLDENVGVVLSKAEQSSEFYQAEAENPLLSDSEKILGSIARLRKRLRICKGLERPEELSHPEESGWGLESLEHEENSIMDDEIGVFEQPDFDEILDSVLEAFSLSFREIMSEDTKEVRLARRSLFYLCARYDISADEVALNFDCTVSEVMDGAKEMDREISNAIDSGADLDQLLVRLFHKG
ncbi:DnaA N-terminal domain-containing protein [Maridesulfovibrio bastinii]|jgi:chromosomal replication initiation ATPase DnaA|uniref:DnaA N-terminal domain-containing protein n=1 Tax=Maridesulfovibrio bastinii TaxID=47157 RepID=UPI00040BAE6C|nr:DnaA N-terminal domain-containing protein [Maridesulfovibrio bastinii]